MRQAERVTRRACLPVRASCPQSHAICNLNSRLHTPGVNYTRPSVGFVGGPPNIFARASNETRRTPLFTPFFVQIGRGSWRRKKKRSAGFVEASLGLA